MFPNYCYQPRKSVEKKRRMTTKKAVKVGALAHALATKEDSVNKDFGPLRDADPPVLTFGPFGPHEMVNLVLGSHDVTAEDLCAMLEENNDKCAPMEPNDRRHQMPSIVTASPAAILSGDIHAYDQISDWEIFQSAHKIDEGLLDEEFRSYWIDPMDPRKGVRSIGPYAYYAKQELQRLARFQGAPANNLAHHGVM